MPELLLIILAVICLVVGVIGTVAPLLPGVPVSWIGLLILKFVPATKDSLSWTLIIVLGIITLVVTILDNILPLWGTKKMGGNKKVVWGATIGLLIGLFLGPLGVIFGPFLGALIASLLSGTKLNKATMHASGAFIGYIAGLIVKLATVGLIALFFVKAFL